MVTISENSGTNRTNDMVRRGIAGQNHARVRLQGADTAGNLQTVRSITSLPGQYDIERESSQTLLHIGPPIGLVYGAVFPLENAPEELVRGTLVIHKQQAAGTQGISLH
jgi:hypothetical protein